MVLGLGHVCCGGRKPESRISGLSFVMVIEEKWRRKRKRKGGGFELGIQISINAEP